MTSIVIQFVRLIAFVHLLRKSSELQQEGYLPKTILLSWLFRALWSYLSPRHKISSIAFVIHNDPQLITGWAHGTTEFRKWKNIVSPSKPHFSVRYLSIIVTETVKLSLALESDSRLPTSFKIFTNVKPRGRRFKIANKLLTSLSPFPFKACWERIIDFHSLALTTFSDEKFWTNRVLRRFQDEK